MTETEWTKEYRFKLEKEYYAYDKFDGSISYNLIGDMMYEKFYAYKLQIWGEEKREALQVYPDYHKLNEEDLASAFPMSSQF